MFVRASCLRVFAELIHRIVEIHAPLHREAFRLVCDGILTTPYAETDTTMAAKRQFLTQTIHMLTVPAFGQQFGTPLLRYIHSHEVNLDYSFLRHIAVTLWNVLDRPFQDSFASAFLEMISGVRMHNALTRSTTPSACAVSKCISEWKREQKNRTKPM